MFYHLPYYYSAMYMPIKWQIKDVSKINWVLGVRSFICVLILASSVMVVQSLVTTVTSHRELSELHCVLTAEPQQRESPHRKIRKNFNPSATKCGTIKFNFKLMIVQCYFLFDLYIKFVNIIICVKCVIKKCVSIYACQKRDKEFKVKNILQVSSFANKNYSCTIANILIIFIILIAHNSEFNYPKILQIKISHC